jgi:hypothetical protein
MIRQFLADRPCRDLAPAPTFDAERQAQGGVSHATFDFAQPPSALGAEAKLDGSLFKGETLFGAVGGKGHRSGYSDHLNNPSSTDIQMASTDLKTACSHDLNMAPNETHDWYLREWFATMGMKQRDLVTKLDYQPALAHALWHSVQRYRRDHVDQISALLNIQPYELLMPPEEAMAMRRLKSAIAEVARVEPTSDVATTPGNRTGTDG